VPRLPIFSVFKRSPVWPLQDHMGQSNDCVQMLLPFFEALIKQDWRTAKKLQADISEAEEAADTMKRDLRAQLPRGLFLTIPRGDILDLLTTQDELANQAKDIAGVAYGRRMGIPENLVAPLLDFLRRCLEASRKAKEAIDEIEELFVTGFSEKEVKIVEKMIKELHKIERDTDKKQIAIRTSLFAQEDRLLPVDVVFLYKIVNWIGNLADCAEQLGARLQLLLAC